jgi:hypothetical protein
MGRSIAAVVVGYLVMAVLIAGTTLLHLKLLGIGLAELQAPHPNLPDSFAVVNIIYSTFFAAVGGWICAAIAKRARLKHGVILAVLVFVLSLISVYIDRGKQPVWYQACLVLFGAPATAAGAWVRAKRD